MSPIPLEVGSLVALHEPPSTSPHSSSGAMKVQVAQTDHRINLINAWGGKAFFEGGSVLELGCGQGDMSVVLASAVSSETRGKVLAWDPARGDYGAPMTLAEAHGHILSHKELQEHLSFSLTTSLSSVLSPESTATYTHAVLAHSLYYFPSPDVISSTFRALAAHTPPIKYLCLAEHGLQATYNEQMPHLLAVLAQSAAYALQIASGASDKALAQANVRTVLSPAAILKIAAEAGWVVAKDRQGQESQSFSSPSPELQDGGWECGTAVSNSWLESVKQSVGLGHEPEIASIEAMRDTTRNLVGKAKENGSKPRTMDVWCAVLERHD